MNDDTPKWDLVPDYPADLFAGTAEYYARYRIAYPERLLQDLLERSGTSSPGGRLVDLACGTGEIALRLAPHFDEVLAVDQEPEMITVARRKADGAGVTNLRWTVGRAEDLDISPGSVDLVTIGNAFHRLDRRHVADQALAWLGPGRCLAVLGGNVPTTGNQPWQAITREVLARWTPTPTTERARPAGKTSPKLTHQDVLENAGFQDVREHQFPTPHQWSLDELLGYLRSTSFAKGPLTDHPDDFEADLRRTLLAHDPSGEYRETIAFYTILARAPR